MAVFKATQNKSDSAGKFKATKNRSYDSTLVYDWETRNKESYDALEKYRQRINSGGYLSADDLTAYRKALDSYVETSTSLRGFSKAMGQGKDDDDAWTKTIADMESGYKGISDYFSQWKTEVDFRAAMEQAKADEKRMAELTNGYDPTKNQQEGMTGWDDFQAYLDRTKNQQQAQEKEKTIWDTILEGIGAIGSDTSLPGIGGSQVAAMSEEAQRNDTELAMPKDRWTDEERYRFGYLWNTERQKAWDYARAVNMAYAKQDESAKIQGIQASATDNFWAGAGHTLGALATSPLGMADYLKDLITYGAVGYVPQADGEVSPFEYSQAVTSGVANHLNDAGGTINDNIPVLGGKGWGDVYGLGTSIAQSSLAAYTGGSGQALITFFGSAAASGVDDALSRGADGAQALFYGTSVGAAEALAEMAGIDNLLKIGASAGKQLLFTLVKQAGAEGLEEGLTTFLGNVADQVWLGDKSNFYLRVQAYMSAGFNESEAKSKAWSELWGELAFDALGGFVSGAVHAGPQTAYHTFMQNSYAKNTYGGSQQELVGEALEINPDNAFAKKMQGRLDSGKNLSGGQLNALVQQNEATMAEQDMASIQKAAAQRLTELGATENVEATAAALAKQAAGQVLSHKEKQLIKEYGSVVSQEMNPENIRSGKYNAEWAQKIGTNKINANEYSRALMDLAQEQTGAKLSRTNPAGQSQEIASAKGNLTTQGEIVSESHYEVSDDGQMVDTKTGNTIDPQGLVKAADGTYKIAAKDAEPVSTSDVSYADNNQALVYETFVNLEGNYGKTNKVIASMDLDSRNALLGMYSPEINKDGGAFAKAAVSAYFYGHQGIPFEAIAKDPLMGELTDQQRKIAWNQGRMVGMKATTDVQANVDTVYAEAKKALEQTGAKKGAYHAVLDDGISPMQLNEKQRAVYSLADEIAQGVQTNIRVYDGTNKAQGFYNHATDEIWLNLNAAKTSREHIMAFTLAHELVHRAKKGSPAKYKAFTEFLLNEYGKQGSDIEAMIREQMDAAERFNKTVPKSKQVNMTREKALEEVVCDACSRMLLDTNAGQKLAEFGAQSRQNKSFLEDLKRWISELLDKLRNYFKGVDPDSKAAKEFAKFDESVKQVLADMYVDMSIDAGEKLSTIKAAYGGAFAEKFLGTKDIQYNLAAVETHKDKLQKEYSDESSTDLETIMKRYNKIIDIWTRLGGELKSNFLAEWNSKIGKDRTFTIFKAQAGYKYNVELSSMCKKGVPLFEAIDTIVKQEVMKELNLAVLGKAEKEILYDILKRHHFEIPCAICYVEQARQREGVIIDAFLNGKVEKNAKGETTKEKLGWNQVLDSIQKEMKANGVDYSFAQVSRDIATEKYSHADLSMDAKTQDAFYAALKKIANQEISRYNKAEGKSRKLLADVTPEAVKECFKGTLPANLKIFKVLFEEPSSRFKITSDLLYSSVATQNLSMVHNKLYGLFNSQGGVSGYKTKQGTTIYWGDILGKSWKPDILRNEGGVRNQSNSDFQMYTLLDQAQMYIDFTAKGYYLQAYTKVLSELKLFGLSRGKINASLIPRVVVYLNADGTDVDVERTMATAGLDENGNPIYDDIEGINHNEAFMLIEDPEYSKSICGICIGYSDAHIRKLLDDSRVQQIIGFHDKTDDGTKRYKGARYAKNYNGLNEAVNKDGKTVHIGFNPYVKKAEKKFKFNAETETFEGTVNYNGKTYTADDIPKLAADLYLEMCAKKGYTPAYDDFKGHPNYYKLLADFGLYDSQGHYAPHRKVVYNMPDTVPYLDANGKKQTMKTYDYIEVELKKELAVRDSIAEALADTSSEGIIPQFKAAVKKSQEEKSYSLPKVDADGNQLTEEQQEFFKDSKVRDDNGNLIPMYHGTNTPNFTVFDPKQSDDNISLFFTSDPDVANTYTQLQDKGRDVDPYNLITKDSSAEQFNKAQERVGGGLRVVKITPEWIQEMKGKAEKSATRLFGVANKYADLLAYNNSTGVFSYDIERIREITGKGVENLKTDDVNKLRKAMGDAEQHSFFATDHKGAAKEIRRIYHDAFKMFAEVWNYKTAAATPDSAIGQYTYTETNSSVPFMVDRNLDFLGHIIPGTEQEMVAKALDRMQWVVDHNLGNRYKVYLNITNPYVIDAGIHYSGNMDYISLKRSTTSDGWKVSFENSDYDEIKYMSHSDFMSFIESAFDSETTAKIKAQIEADNEAYRKEWGDDFYEDMDVDHDIQLRNVQMDYMESGNWNDLHDSVIADFWGRLDDDAPLRTRDVSQYAKANGYDGVIFKNMKDAGGYAFMKGRNGSTVVTAFSSEQVKSVDNKKPTSDPDIRYSLPKEDGSTYQDPAYEEWAVEAALYDALEHRDMGDDNLILVGDMPRFVVDKIGIEGDFYIYRNHAYENMVSAEQAKKDTRFSAKAHYHNLGIEKMTDAIMALENPIMTIATKTKDGNPAVIMILPVDGKNKAPLYAVLSFYSDRKINGDYSRKPHIVLTISEREYFGNGSNRGYAEIVKQAVAEGRVIDFDKKMRDSLSVIANQARVGDITDASLNANLSHFRKEIKSFREKNHIDYKLPVGEDTSPRALLANAFEGIITNDIEKRRLQEYKGKVDMLNAEEQKLHALRAQIKKLSFAKGKRDTKKIKDLQFDAIQTANRIATLDKVLLGMEAAAPLQNILKREKEMAYKRAEQKGKEALEAYKKAERERDAKWQSEVKEKYQASKKKAIETREKREAREKLQKLVLDTAKWISYPSKTDVKCPDILKQPYANFLNGIDLSSKRLADGGDPTKTDLRLASSMESLATALDKIMTSQDPTQETDKVLDTGYLDLPADFVRKLRDMTESIKAMMVDGDFVVNNMSAEEVRKLSQMIRTLNHAIKTMSNLYANLRFANVEALGFDTMEFMDALGEIEKTGGVKDFVEWKNALPYYAFKRFGKGGESIFEGLMDAQDKLAHLSQIIFNFQEKTWSGDEAKAWSEDTHTIDLPDGNKLTLTTADAMSIYCLSRREQGLQHLLGGGTRVMGIQKGSQKAKDSRSLLTIKDIDVIISSLTDRQKQVAEAMQAFMSDTCSEWGNEISMKRFLTKEFNERFYFPIESNDENLPTKDPAAQQSDLFRLLNISATKPLTPGANNEVIIRNIFDVFSGHAADMARLNAFGMALLDYMKWLNYREKTVNEEGQIKVKGVRKSMENAFGDAAKSYVMNLVKDVNGRPSDNGLPGFYTRLVRNTKTAMVGNSLRVATLQITSYPRAALVLSPKSLALGLSKMPNIEKAKKYCGIALWKSYGFYDTNISRSIEDQMKGVKDVRQKLIELSLKGAEIGDAITWGALWNACEYEVAQTTKNKVGSEEFYQEVGNKLREVVYRTQVVDSVLTRSEMMRSKNAKAQELSAFMSEPTLSANILMDAGMEFSMEKRRTGSAKAAWQKTGKYVTRAVAVYAIGQLAAALMEGLWDAWRDDEDEEFTEKFANAFAENLVLDLLPFNKIPILSEMAEGAMSLMGIGYFSSDSLSSTALSQTVSAVKAWSGVLSGNSSSTVYNALYKSLRAVSSFYGVAFSGVMREAVALWNNTAGAYDPTLKILTYERSKTDLGNLLYDAIISGDDNQAESIRSEFRDRANDDKEYQSSINSAIRKALRENDPRILKAAQAVVNGNAIERANIAREIVAEGHFSLQDIQAAINAEIDKLRKEAKGN